MDTKKFIIEARASGVSDKDIYSYLQTKGVVSPTETTQTTPVEAPKTGILANLKSNLSAGIDKIKSGFQTTQKGAMNKDLTQGATEQARGALGIASGAISTAFSPVTTAFQSASQLPVVKQVIGGTQKNIIDPLVDKVASLPSIQKFAMENPNSQDVISDLINVIGTVYSPQIGKGATKTAGAVSNVVKPVAGEALQRGGQMLQNTATKGLEQVEQKNLMSAIRDVMPIENKANRIQALSSATPESGVGKGGVARKGLLKTVEIQPSQLDIDRGNIAYKYIKGEKDNIGKIQKLNKGVETISNEIDSTFDTNPVNANFEDMIKYIEQNNTPTSNLQKDTTAFEAYQRASKNALNTLYNTMKDSARASGDFSGNLSVKDVRKARINIDQQIKNELGEEVFGSPQYKGIKSAEVSVRNVVNRLSEDLVRYPNQLEKLNKMNDFIAEAKSRGIELDRMNPNTMAKLEQQFNLTKTAESDALANQISAKHKDMSYLYESKDNLVDKYQDTIGDNVVTKTLDRVGKIVGSKNQGVQTLVSLGILGGAGALASTALPLTLATGAGYLLYRGGKWVVSPQVRKAIGDILETSGNKLNPADKKILEQLSGKGIPNKQGGFINLNNIKESLNTKVSLPKDETFLNAVKNTEGAEITKDGLKLKALRFQTEEQGGMSSVRTGVFYLPSEKSTGAKFYKGSNGYGGSEKMTGDIVVQKPLFVKGSTGGKAPEIAYDTLNGKGAYQKMRSDVLDNVVGYNLKRYEIEENLQALLEKYNKIDSAEAYDMAYNIIENSKSGNLLPYAVQENIVANAVRNSGHDSVLGYSVKKDGSKVLSELFDVREISYPEASNMAGEISSEFIK